MKNIGTHCNTTKVLNKFHLKAKKSLGQNFLVDLNIIENIVCLLPDDQEICVIEIGPGIGSLTEFLARKVKRVIAYEIDQRMVETLNYTLAEYDNVEIRHQDFLNVDLDECVQSIQEPRVIVVSNLPYYITSQLLLKIICCKEIEMFVGMMQKEVALKLCHHTHFPLSIMMHVFSDVRYEFSVSNQVFIPKPNVDSAVISFKTKKDVEMDLKGFYLFLQDCFRQKRKTIYNNLIQKYSSIDVILQKCDIDSKLRPEQIEIEKYIQMYKLISSTFIL